jgi:putative flippase GtrA
MSADAVAAEPRVEVGGAERVSADRTGAVQAGAERVAAERTGAEQAGAERVSAVQARARRAAVAALATQVLRFGAVGATNTALTLGAYALLSLVGVPGPAAAALGWAIGAVNGYRLNRGWTFRSALRGLTPAARYVAVQALGAGLDALGVWLVVAHGELPRFEGEIAILPAVTLLTFALCRGWVFA